MNKAKLFVSILLMLVGQNDGWSIGEAQRET